MKHMTRLILPDVHFPFHDPDLLDAWLAHAEALKPDGIDILGDLMDCYTLSRFDRNPARKFSFQEEINCAHSFLAGLCGHMKPGCDIRYSEGNHEDRLRKVVWKKVPELADQIPTVPAQLELKKLGIKWHSTQNPYCIRDLWYCHNDLLRQAAGMSARAKADQIHASVITAHTHREGWSPRTTWMGIEDAYEVGHLSDYRQLDYVKTTPNWQQGWAVVEFPSCGGHFVNFVTVRGEGKKRVILYKGEVL